MTLAEHLEKEKAILEEWLTDVIPSTESIANKCMATGARLYAEYRATLAFFEENKE